MHFAILKSYSNLPIIVSIDQVFSIDDYLIDYSTKFPTNEFSYAASTVLKAMNYYKENKSKALN